MKIGDIEVANRVFLAPMSGVTDASVLEKLRDHPVVDALLEDDWF